MSTSTRIFNFSAGPAILPLEVLEEAQRNLLALPGVGMSILEISHRSKTFDDIIQGCDADMRTLAKIPKDYKILFLQGGASLQFSMVPMNLLPSGRSADYIVTGAGWRRVWMEIGFWAHYAVISPVINRSIQSAFPTSRPFVESSRF